jgi:UDP-N-acetylglucosamine:LPS N-acetylglucosamine transferase
MKITIPIFGFAASGGGRVLSELANKWMLLGNSVTFICFADSINPYFPTNANIIWIDYSGHKVKKNNLKIKNYPLRYFFIRKYLKKAIENFGADSDIILATHSFTALPVSLAKVKGKKFYYIQAHETEYYAVGGFKHVLYKLAAKASYKYNLHRIVNCELYLDYKEIKADMFVYPGIDLTTYYSKQTQISSF